MAAGTNAVGVSAEQVAPGGAARPGAEISVTDTTGQAAKLAREERQKMVSAAQRGQTGNEINAVRENPDALLEVLRERNRSLTRSTGKEAAGNRVEQARATEAQTVLMSQLADVRKRIARHEAQIKRGEKADLSEAEVAAMNAQLGNLAKAIEAGISDLGVAGRKVFLFGADFHVFAQNNTLGKEFYFGFMENHATPFLQATASILITAAEKGPRGTKDISQSECD